MPARLTWDRDLALDMYAAGAEYSAISERVGVPANRIHNAVADARKRGDARVKDRHRPRPYGDEARNRRRRTARLAAQEAPPPPEPEAPLIGPSLGIRVVRAGSISLSGGVS